MNSQGVKQFRLAGPGRSETFLSYCVWDRESRAAILVNPEPGLDQEYVDFVTANRLKRVPCNEFPIEVLPTPGIRPDSICLLGDGFVLTEETLWVGASSAFGAPGSKLETLWNSLGMLKRTVPADALVFSGFDVNGLCFSTWQTELEKNPDLMARDLSELAKLKSNDRSRSGEVSTAHSSISAEKLGSKLPLKATSILIDVREAEEFRAGHVPGATNISLSEIPFQLNRLKNAQRIYVYGQSSSRGTLAAATLSYIGLNDVVVLNGGIQAWQNAGLPIEKA